MTIRNRILFFTLLLAGCTNQSTSRINNNTIIIQPFNDFSKNEISLLAGQIRQYYTDVRIATNINLPLQSYTPLRKRYRADSIINWLREQATDNQYLIGITTKDISTTKGKEQDWGVMGLGFCPGRACVASTFRLPKQNRSLQLFKVAIHELGHTQGLQHCKVDTCFMRDAGGHNICNELTNFCFACKTILKEKGWQVL